MSKWEDRTLLRLLAAVACHAFQQFAHIPDLLVGRDFAVFQERRAALVIQWAFEQVQARTESLDELVDAGLVRCTQGVTLNEADGGGVWIVDVLPVRAVPVPALFPGASLERADRLHVGRTPVEVRHTQAGSR